MKLTPTARAGKSILPAHRAEVKRGEIIMEAKITVDPIDLEQIINGAQRLALGMCQEVYALTEEGVLKNNPSLTREQNAQTFLASYYELSGGAFGLIAASLNVVATALTNNEIELREVPRS
jgi:hypothetical protein